MAAAVMVVVVMAAAEMVAAVMGVAMAVGLEVAVMLILIKGLLRLGP